MATKTVKSLRAVSTALSKPSPRNLDVFRRSLTSTANFRSLEIAPQSRYPTYPSPSFQHRQPPQAQLNAFDKLLAALTHSLSTTGTPHLPTLHAFLRNYSSEYHHWSRYAHGDPSKQYTRNLVHEVPGLFNLLLLVWTPGKASPVHDHADSHCLMKVLSGELRERRFAFPRGEGPLTMTNEMRVERDKVAYISDKLGLHEISNPSGTEFAVSLHCEFFCPLGEEVLIS